MKIINQSHKILIESDPLKLIEAAGRTCYKSEERITPDSASKFVSSIVRSGHWSVLEHASIAFQIDEGTFYWIRKVMSRVDLADNYVNDDSYLTLSNLDRFVVSGNFRAWKEYLSIPNVLMNDDLRGINYYLAKSWPEIFTHIVATRVMVEALETSEMTLAERILHKRISVRFIMDRISSQSLVRHREASFSQESTRYVRYSDEIEYIIPVGIEEIITDVNQAIAWELCKQACVDNEKLYHDLLDLGWSPQRARAKLSFDVKTEIVMTASLREWYHVMKLRTASKAHPQIRALMTGLLDELIEIEQDVFGGLS